MSGIVAMLDTDGAPCDPRRLRDDAGTRGAHPSSPVTCDPTEPRACRTLSGGLIRLSSGPLRIRRSEPLASIPHERTRR
jgi:hypothetical protein